MSRGARQAPSVPPASRRSPSAPPPGSGLKFVYTMPPGALSAAGLSLGARLGAAAGAPALPPPPSGPRPRPRAQPGACGWALEGSDPDPE